LEDQEQRRRLDMRPPRSSKGAHPRSFNHEEKEEEEDEEESQNNICRDGNIIYFFSDVTCESVVSLITHLKKANLDAIRHSISPSEARVYLHIHSDGGDAYAGITGMEHIRCNPVKVVCIANGFVASSASFLLVSGHERWAFQHSNILIHQLSTMMVGKFEDLKDDMKNSTNLMSLMKDMYRKKTRIPNKKLNQFFKKDVILSAKESLNMGIVHKLM